MSKFNPLSVLDKHEEAIVNLFQELSARTTVTNREFQSLIRNLARKTGIIFSKHELQQAYQLLYQKNHPKLPKLPKDSNLIRKLRLKPIHTLSGVATLTVLTKPFPCPGKCIFCPNDVRMPKSYLANKPGAQRALKNNFDPYLQTYNRLQALNNIGHPIDKIEVIILGGTWSFYPEKYQIWFVKRIFEALNDFSENLDKRAQILNTTANLDWQTIKYIPTTFRNTERQKRSITSVNKGVGSETENQNSNLTYNQIINQILINKITSNSYLKTSKLLGKNCLQNIDATKPQSVDVWAW